MTGQLYSPVDGAPVPGTGASNVVHLEQRNRQLLAEVEALTTALASANTTIETLRGLTQPARTDADLDAADRAARADAHERADAATVDRDVVRTLDRQTYSDSSWSYGGNAS